MRMRADLIAAVVAAALAPAGAHALAVAEADFAYSLSVDAATPSPTAETAYEAESVVFDLFTDEIGSASASADATADGFISGELPGIVGAGAVTEASGEASASAKAGDAFASSATDSFLLIDNTLGPTDLEVFVTVDYMLSAGASVDVPALEDAFATSGLLVELFDGAGSFLSELLFDEAVADALFDEPGFMISDSVALPSFIVPAGEAREVVALADASAFAVSEVPVPAALPLLAAGLGALVAFRRRA